MFICKTLCITYSALDFWLLLLERKLMLVISQQSWPLHGKRPSNAHDGQLACGSRSIVVHYRAGFPLNVTGYFPLNT